VPLDPFARKLLLDWVLGGAAATQPGSRWVSYATQSPTTQSAFDGPFRSRGTLKYAAANSPQMSATILSSASPQGTSTAIMTAVGWNMWNSSSGGQRLMYGTFGASVGMASNDTIVIAAAAQMKITLS
jgi:hypothetical protein